MWAIHVAWAVAISALLTSHTVSGAEAKEQTPSSNPAKSAAQTKTRKKTLPPVIPRPDFIRNRPLIPDALLINKKEGWYFTLLPGVGYNPAKGVTIGGLTEVYYNDQREDPFFRTAPYRRKIFAGGSYGSNDYWDVRLNLDEPYIADSAWRLRVENRAQRWGRENYFGVGEDAMGPLSFPGSDQTFDNHKDFEKALEREQDGQAYTRYNSVDITSIRTLVATEVDLFGGLVRPLVGFSVGHYWVNDFTGQQVDAVNEAGDEIKAPQATTKLAEDCAANRVSGCAGGFDNYLKLGLTFDSRHFEPDPDYGILAQVVTELSGKFLGSVENYMRLTTSLAGYYSLLPKWTRLIAAGRVLYSMGFGDIPFFVQNVYAFNVEDRSGLGDFQTMRGVQRNRYVGKVGALVNLELRWFFANTTIWKQHLGFGLVPFFETGRVWDAVDDFNFRKWQWSGGGGVRLTWNLSTVISFDYGVSKETRLFVMELGHQF